jgi:hypothetical protein
MGDRKNPFLEAGFGEYKGIHRMPFALKDRATTHETNRQRVVSSILLELHLMALLGIIPKEKPLTLHRASLQSLSGDQDDATEAAHCAPRQIMVGTEPVQDLLRWSFPERAWALGLLFAETDILPANFNKCDSRAERVGLNAAFREASQFAVETAHRNDRNDKLEAIEIVPKIAHAYGIYKARATFAFMESIERLKDKLKPKFLFPKDKAKWTEQLQISEQYADTLKSSPGKELGVSLWKVEGLIKVYKTPSSV